LLAVAMTYITFRSILQYLFTISWIPTEWAGIGILAGVVFGLIASNLSVRKHLREL
jgi:prolipoprotein diacylglyceryltransferase